jgi:hypothetical protein
MQFQNTTRLSSPRLLQMFEQHTQPYCHDRLRVLVRYSRGAAFSGTCFYADSRIHVNLGRRNRYPFALGTSIAKAHSNRTRWWREIYRMNLEDAYQLVLFVYLHELFHYLVKVSGHAPRRKEAMCDRFATRVLVDCYDRVVLDRHGRPVSRDCWDFQDLEAFVSRAPRHPIRATAARREIPVRIANGDSQLTLF